MSEWLETLWLNRAQIALVLVALLTALRPVLIANGFSEMVIDQLIALLGNLTVAAVRSTVPAETRGYTYTATGFGAATAAVGLAGLISPQASLATSSIAFAVSGLGFNSAIKRVSKR